MWTDFNHSFSAALRDELHIHDLATDLLLQYLAKCKCSPAQLFSKVIQFKEGMPGVQFLTGPPTIRF